MTSPLTVGDARRLVAAALNHFADHYASELDDDNHAGQYDEQAVTRDITIARTMAGHVTGWTHTTRLREFVEAGATLDEIATLSGDLLGLSDEDAAELDTYGAEAVLA